MLRESAYCMVINNMLNFDEICRVCLRSDRELLQIFDEHQTDDSPDIAAMLLECTNYEVFQFDELPQQICRNCLNAMETAFHFKQTCVKSFWSLTEMLAKSKTIKEDDVKDELIETSSEDEERQDVFPCEYCDKKFLNKKIQRAHRTKEHKNCENICRFCSKEFKRISYLRSHLAIFHPQSGHKSYIECSVCKRQFTQKINMIRHMKSIHKIDIVCDPLIESCDGTVDNDNNEISDADEFIDEASTNPITLMLINENLELKEEKDDNYTDEDSDYEAINEKNQSPIERTSTENIIKASISNEDSDYEPMSEEAQSSLDCISYETVEVQKSEISTDKKKFCCKDCNRSYANVHVYRRHCNEKHSKKAYNFRCRECAESFNSRKDLYTHKMTVGHCTLLCPECGLRCISNSALTVHIRRHTGEKPFKCRFCYKCFPGRDDIRKHEQLHLDKKNFYCETCGKGFLDKRKLIIHCRVHTGEKPYKCPHCPQAFSQGGYLKVHIRTHTGERLYCEYCDAGFLQLYQLRQHKFLEHDIQEGPKKNRVFKFTSLKNAEKQIKTVRKQTSKR